MLCVWSVQCTVREIASEQQTSCTTNTPSTHTFSIHFFFLLSFFLFILFTHFLCAFCSLDWNNKQSNIVIFKCAFGNGRRCYFFSLSFSHSCYMGRVHHIFEVAGIESVRRNAGREAYAATTLLLLLPQMKVNVIIFFSCLSFLSCESVLHVRRQRRPRTIRLPSLCLSAVIAIWPESI